MNRPQAGRAESSNLRCVKIRGDRLCPRLQPHHSPSTGNQNGDTTGGLAEMLNFKESFLTSVEGTACTAFVSGFSLRVAYLNAVERSMSPRTSSRPAARLVCS